MKLTRASISNYRSITDASALPISEYTVLVGPNNEGKSNILKAITLALNAVSRGNIVQRTRNRALRFEHGERFDFDYKWARDFPVQLQESNPDGRSVVILEFTLTDSDFDEFRSHVGVNLQTKLKVKLSFGNEDIGFEVMMPGKGKQSLNAKRKEVAEFVQAKLSVQYVSAIRPARQAQGIVEDVLDSELRKLEEKDSYRKLLTQLQAEQRPVFEAVSDRIQKSVAEFLPDVRSVRVDALEGVRNAVRSGSRLIIDDGVQTDLQYKGDGVISLTSISLVLHMSQQAAGQRSLVFLVEEPESHLHPAAIGALRRVLHEIANVHQVIITTHSAGLVERANFERNILVEGGKGRRVKSIKQIRDSLGIQLSDNLANALLVLLVEGTTDAEILHCLLPQVSGRLRAALADGTVAIDHLAGATNLSYKATYYRAALSNIFVFLDADAAGRGAVETAIERGFLADQDYLLANCPGMPESEMEDLFKPESYGGLLEQRFGVVLGTARRNARGKWSDRLRNVMLGAGKQWNERIESAAKQAVVEAVNEVGVGALDAHRRSALDNLVAQLEARVAGLGQT